MRFENPERLQVTTLDLLKTAAVVLMVVDHVGLYLAPDPWFRVLGRGAAIVFGFLIGYSGATRVPPSWIGLGLGLTLLDSALDTGDGDDTKIDILITLALTRIVMPFFDGLHARNPILLVPSAVALGLASEPLAAIFDYGSEIAMVALLGLAARREKGGAGQRATRDGVGLVALVGMSLISLRHFGFDGALAIGCVAVIGLTILALVNFRPRALDLVAALRGPLMLCGRYTLWIYAIHLAVFEVIAWASEADLI